MSLDEIQKLDRKELIAQVVEQVRQDRPEFDSSCFDMITIEQNEHSVQVTMETPFDFYPLGEPLSHESFRVKVNFWEDRVVALIPDLLFVPSDAYRKIASHVGRESGDIRTSVTQTQSGYELTISHGDGSAEGFSIDPDTGEMEMLWHEHPDY